MIPIENGDYRGSRLGNRGREMALTPNRGVLSKWFIIVNYELRM